MTINYSNIQPKNLSKPANPYQVKNHWNSPNIEFFTKIRVGGPFKDFFLIHIFPQIVLY